MDGRRQTQIEKNYDPDELVAEFGTSLFGRRHREIDKMEKVGDNTVITYGGDWLKVGTATTQSNKLVLPTDRISNSWLMGDTIILTMYGEDIQSLSGMKGSDGKHIFFKEGKDYLMLTGKSEWVYVDGTKFTEDIKVAVFKYGVIKGDHFTDDEMTVFKEDVLFYTKNANSFALFQDKIVTEAIRKQMQRNGLEPVITYNEDLGFHVMPLPDSSQRLILERGQPKYAPVRTIELPKSEFSVLPRAESATGDLRLDKFKTQLLRKITNASSAADLKKELKDIVC